MTGLMNKLNEEMELMKKKKDINDLQLTVSAEEIERLENHVENLKSHALQLLEDKQEALLLQFEYRMVENVLVKVPMKRGSELEDKIEDTNDQQKEKMIAISDYSKEMDPAPVQVAIEDTFVPSFKEECKDIDEISIDSTLSENFVSAVQSLEQHELQLDQAPFETKRTAAAAYWSKILQRWFKL